MILVLLALYDSAAEGYMRPFFSPSRGEAIRSFGDLVKDQTHPVGQHPEDYTLFELATFNPQTGQLTVERAPVSLGNGVDFSVLDRVRKLEAVNE